MVGTHILRILIDLLVRKVVLVQGEVVVVAAHRQIIHLIDEIFELGILLAGELLDLLPNFFALCVLFSFSVAGRSLEINQLNNLTLMLI
jgi:hypothetical protein